MLCTPQFLCYSCRCRKNAMYCTYITRKSLHALLEHRLLKFLILNPPKLRLIQNSGGGPGGRAVAVLQPGSQRGGGGQGAACHAAGRGPSLWIPSSGCKGRAGGSRAKEASLCNLPIVCGEMKTVFGICRMYFRVECIQIKLPTSSASTQSFFTRGSGLLCSLVNGTSGYRAYGRRACGKR